MFHLFVATSHHPDITALRWAPSSRSSGACVASWAVPSRPLVERAKKAFSGKTSPGRAWKLDGFRGFLFNLYGLLIWIHGV